MHFHYECDDNGRDWRHASGRGRSFRFGPFDFDFDFDGGPGRGGWGGRRGRERKRMFSGGELRLVLLKLIADQPRHGYELIRAIEELSGGSYVPSPGVVYPTLTLLQDMGQIEEAASDGSRKAFAATADGTAELAAKKDEVEALLARLAQLAGVRGRTDAAPIRRAMANLRTVLMYRLDREEVRPEALHEIAAILDEAAQKIERLQ